MEPCNMQTVEMFGKQIEYDASKLYGGYDNEDIYGEMSVGSTLASFAKVENKEQVISYLQSQVIVFRKNLTVRLERDKRLEDMLAPLNKLYEEFGSEQTMEPVIGPEIADSVQNTIELFEYIVLTLQN